jgi:hypothetical protein
MFPDHCKEVSVKRVDFPLTTQDIIGNLEGKKAYKRTRFIALNNGDDWALVEIQKGMESDLFGTISGIDVLSLPDSTFYYEDNSINVLSPTMMAEKAEQLGCYTLIVKGKFEHVSFVHHEKMQSLLVFEAVPPDPPKLTEIVKTALNSGNVKVPVIIIPKVMDLNDLAKKSEKDIIVFPCQASQLNDDRRTLYLDELPEISKEDLSNAALIGCDLSLRIFKEHYGTEPEFHNFCPKKRAEEDDPEIKTLTKCCQVKEGYSLSNNTAMVPWGATQREVEDALNELLIKGKGN